MGYVHIKRPDGTEIFLGLDSPQDEVVMICDSCNSPKPESQGEIQRDGEGIDVMWLCGTCRTMNYGKPSA